MRISISRGRDLTDCDLGLTPGPTGTFHCPHHGPSLCPSSPWRPPVCSASPSLSHLPDAVLCTFPLTRGPCRKPPCTHTPKVCPKGTEQRKVKPRGEARAPEAEEKPFSWDSSGWKEPLNVSVENLSAFPLPLLFSVPVPC